MSPQAPLVPFRWPSAWTDPALLRLLAASPINCLVFESLAAARPVADAARAAGLAVLEWSALSPAPLSDIQWNSTAPQIAITELAWPRIKLSARTRGAADAGPTGAPWIDSNTWVARLAAARAPRRSVWLAFQTAKDDPVPRESDYIVAIADSAACGARWMVALDDGLRQGLPASNADALKTWRGILAALAFFENHREWNAWEPSGSAGILSSFSGKDEFLSQELLNLAARRNLFYRVLVRSVPESLKLDGLTAVLYVDADPPSADLKNRLARFARSGGLLIVPRALAAQFPGEKPVTCPVAGYDLRSFGQGSVAAATRDWDDPYFLAADAHSLVKRRNDPVTLFNARSMWGHWSMAPAGNAALLQLVAFTSRPNDSLSMAPARPWRSAAMYTIGADRPAMLEPIRVEGRMEFHLPAFANYTALEFHA